MMMEIDLNPTEHHLLLIEEQRDRVILLEAERYLIGRIDSNEIVLNHDPISREHVTLVRVPAEDESNAIEPDHVHLFLNYDPNMSIAQIMHRIKGDSSYPLR